MDKKDAIEKLKRIIFQEEKNGKIVLNTVDGLIAVDIQKIIDQPTEGLLYDLNRDKVTILSFTDTARWINDYATLLVITELKKYYDKVMEMEDENQISI